MLRDFSIFGNDISFNYVMVVLSFIIMSFINYFRCKKYGVRPYHGIMIAFLVNVFGVLSAILMFKLENISRWNEVGIGLSFYGTVFFLPIFMFIISLLYKIEKRRFIDIWAITIPLELALVRFACFLEGCCLGIVASWGVHFPFDSPGVLRIPVQLFEIVFDLSILIGLIIYERKYKKMDGNIYWIFMSVYSFGRYLLEFIRDTPKDTLGMSNGQIFAFIGLIVGILMIFANSQIRKINLNK